MSFYELFYAMEIRLSKQMILNAKVSFDTFGKELGIFGLVLAVLLPNLTLSGRGGGGGIRPPKVFPP